MPPACPHCGPAHPIGDDSACAQCRGRWFPGAEVTGLASGKLPAFRRLLGKGPLTHLNCADCRSALKALDVTGPVHEGDLFWGLESARPAGTATAEGCPRCGGVWIDEANLRRAGGVETFRGNLARVMMLAS